MTMKILKNKQGTWDWSKVAVSIFILFVLPLVGLVYNNMADTIKEVKKTVTENVARIEDNVKTKVSEKSLMQYIALQQQRIDMLQEDVKEGKIIDKEMLKTLQKLNLNMVLVEQQLKEK